MRDEIARPHQGQQDQQQLARQLRAPQFLDDGSPQHDTQASVPPAMADLASAIQRRQLTTTLLLLLASHRPLTFITGQLLYLFAPLSDLLGIEHVDAWAALLSAPNANARLAEYLLTAQEL